MIFNPPLQMSDIDPMDPLIYKYIPGVMLVFFYLIITWLL